MACPKSAAVATRNPGKIRPVRRALKILCGIGEKEVHVVPPPEGLKPQPFGSLEVFRGALLRALEAYNYVGGKGFGVGVEAGPIEFYTGTGVIETQVAVIIGPGGRVSVGLSQSFELPAGIVERMRRGAELGSLVPWRRGEGDLGESIGYIGVATSGLVTRADLTFQSVVMALVPWYTGEESSLALLEELKGITNI
ncbi:MAG: DUF84 family protein [Desulfurococcales archaeon]|nr:DUF84 family protein [Desulfurococcales archaeon]